MREDRFSHAFFFFQPVFAGKFEPPVRRSRHLSVDTAVKDFQKFARND